MSPRNLTSLPAALSEETGAAPKGVEKFIAMPLRLEMQFHRREWRFAFWSG